MVKGYDLRINYHLGKANVVADVLSCKPADLNALMESLPPKLQEEIAQLNLVIVEDDLANILEVTPTLEDEIRMAQADDKILQGVQGPGHIYSRGLPGLASVGGVPNPGET